MFQRIKFHLLRSIMLLCAITFLMCIAWVWINPNHLRDPVQYMINQGMMNWLGNVGNNLMYCYWASILMGLDCSKGDA